MANFEQQHSKTLWSSQVPANGDVLYRAPKAKQIFIINVTLGVELVELDRRTTLVISLATKNPPEEDEDESDATRLENKHAICSLLPGRAENLGCNIPLSAGQSYQFTAIGPNGIDILGYFEDDEGMENYKEQRVKYEKAERACKAPQVLLSKDQPQPRQDKDVKKTSSVTVTSNQPGKRSKNKSNAQSASKRINPSPSKLNVAKHAPRKPLNLNIK